MADRFPLIINSVDQKIQELSSGDNLDLTGNSLINANHIQTSDMDVVGVMTATKFKGDGSELENLPATGGTLEATASGTLADGSTVIVNTDGTVSAVTQVGSGWIATLGDSGPQYGESIAVDSSGNVYISGQSRPVDQYDCFVAKYNSSGVPQWQRSLGGNSSDYGYSVDVDSSGNVYVVGMTFSQGQGSADVLITKLNSSGDFQWKRLLGGSSADYGYGIAVDSSGNSYITGYSAGGGYGNDDIITAKYDTNGNIEWKRILGGTGNDGGDAIAVDSSGNAYVFAHTESAGAGNYDMIVAKYNSSGSIQWQKTVGTGPGILEWSQGIAIDSSGNIYLAGYTTGSGVGAGSYDYLITKLNSSGAFQWSRTLGGSSLDYARAIAVDSSGNVYVTGETASTGTGMYEGLIVKYDTDGNIQWQRILYGSQNEFLKGIGVDNSGNVYVGGRTASSGEGSDEFIIAKLPDDGTGTGTYGDFTYADSSSLMTDGSRTLTVSDVNLNEAPSSLVDAGASLQEDTPTLDSSVTSMTTSNLTAENYIGISNGAYTDGQTATVQLIGSVDDAQSSLTPGRKYYVQGDGTLSTTADTPSVPAGTAVAATKLMIKK